MENRTGHCDVTDFERAAADWLLEVWDQKIKRGQYSLSPLGPDVKRFRFGRVSGLIRLTTQYVTRSSGVFRIDLIPVDDPNPLTSPHRESVDFDGNVALYLSSTPVLTKIPFDFTTVQPGKYQFKVIWDYAAPFTDTNQAGVGDLEARLTAPFMVTPGGAVTNLVVYCTNLVSQVAPGISK
jgi:hypothetical protein